MRNDEQHLLWMAAKFAAAFLLTAGILLGAVIVEFVQAMPS